VPKALVIGSEGNVGTPLVRHLQAGGYEVLESDIRPLARPGYLIADINQPMDLLPAFDWGPDVVFMLSAIVSRVACEQASGLAIATNLAGINNVLQLCKRTGARLVFFSSSEVYGPGCDPMDEAVSDPKPNNRYGLSKFLGEQLVEYETRTYGLKAVSIRPFMIYDENEEFGSRRSAMIRFSSELAMGRSIQVHSGSARSWLHVSDAVRAMEAAAHIDEYMVINIGHPGILPIEELAEQIRVELGAPGSLIEYLPQPDGMTPIKRPILNRQRDVLGISPIVSLEEGVQRVCKKVQERIAAGGLK
jgi:nucleoside-diphosphate-sugar epimerase|tara:strand:+ start:1712 stop:2623 length:912 start_codon:yes stop_codon:yes gene_type:complete